MAEQIPPGTFMATLAALSRKGMGYGTVIDIGSADGHFYLFGRHFGLFGGAAPFNIDLNATYEDSLRAITDVCGGHYFIGAMSDHLGQVEVTMAEHPYWSSLLPADDPYWRTASARSTVTVQAATLDSLAATRRLKPPYLLKLDVQGVEVQVLRGARQVLQDTDVVICEMAAAENQAIGAVLAEAGFGLLDITDMNRAPDGSLGWFYAVYLNARMDHMRTSAVWDPAKHQDVVAAQDVRRDGIRKEMARLLAKARAKMPAPGN